jgi:hypothetical protein
MTKNQAYMKSIADKVRKLPAFVARRAAYYTYSRIINLNVEGGFDSGQAAANWVIDVSSGTGFSMRDQRMMWGYGDTAPTNPVGYKSYYPGQHEATKGQTGDAEKVKLYQLTYAASVVATITQGITGITIYNPIVSGFSGFAPGSDEFYPANAFAGMGSLEVIGAQSLTLAEADALIFLRGNDANAS